MTMTEDGIRSAQAAWEEGALARVLARFPERRTRVQDLLGGDEAVLHAGRRGGPRLSARPRLSRAVSVHARGAADDVPRAAVDDAAVRGVRHGARRPTSASATCWRNGQTGLSVAFDLPTQIGYDSDDPMAVGEVGQVGVAIDTLADMETMFEGIPLDKISTSMTINAPAAILVAMYMAVAEKQGARGERDHGDGAERRAQGVRGARDVHLPAARVACGWRRTSSPTARSRRRSSTRSRCQRLPHPRRRLDGGAGDRASRSRTRSRTSTSASARGADIDDVAPRISWIFNTHNYFFEEIAKYRALRRMWARLMKRAVRREGCATRWMFRTHTQTGGSTLTAQQPLNNIVRASIQALAAVVGGVQSLALSLLRRGAGDPDGARRSESRCGRSRSSRTRQA